jgi:UDP-galactopyranose mutase
MAAKWLVVGAGLTGCTIAERIASTLDQKVIVIDRRNHIGGNTYDYYDEAGILVHRYGPHIFHTQSQRVWDYLSRFTKWKNYTHRVLAHVQNQYVPLPFNLTSIEKLFSPAKADALIRELLRLYPLEANVPILRLRETTSKEIKSLADYIYQHVFYGYTVKQWGMPPEALDPSVTARVPVRISRDDRYFQDRFQAMPDPGYTAMCERMLSHPNIEVLLEVDFKRSRFDIKYSRMVYTGPIDEYFECIYGALPYRSLDFECRTFTADRVQIAPTLNYPDGREYTRTVEMKQLTGQKHHRSTIIVEYPKPYVRGENEPYYPIPQSENEVRANAYRKLAGKLAPEVIFAGRLADYRYYNMDQAVARALSVFDTQIARS